LADDKWTKPTNPPPPLFLGEKERNLVKQVNDELLERVIGQAITYLPVSQEYTNYHPLYGEAIEKCFLPPIRVYALVEYDGIGTVTENYGLDKSYSITVNFHNTRVSIDQDLYVREGDYVQYGSSFFEIVTIIEEKPLFGQVDYLFQTVAKCVRTRKGLVNLKALPLTSQYSAATNATFTSSPGTEAASTPSPFVAAQIVFEAIDPAGTVPGVLVDGVSVGSSVNHLFSIPAETELDIDTMMVFVNGMMATISETPSIADFHLNESHELITNNGLSPGDVLVIIFLSAFERI